MPDPAPHLPTTTLRLLTDNALVEATFEAVLTTDQYAQLIEADNQTSTGQQLIDALLDLGAKWGIGVAVQRIK